jgi:hypothetical protein
MYVFREEVREAKVTASRNTVCLQQLSRAGVQSSKVAIVRVNVRGLTESVGGECSSSFVVFRLQTPSVKAERASIDTFDLVSSRLQWGQFESADPILGRQFDALCGQPFGVVLFSKAKLRSVLSGISKMSQF